MNSKLIIALLLPFIANINAFAQQHKDYVVKNNNDTIYGEVKNPLPLAGTKSKIKLKAEGSKDKLTFYPRDIKAYKDGDKEYESIPYYPGTKDSMAFAQVIVRGYVTLYSVDNSIGGTGLMPSPGGGGMMATGNNNQHTQVLKKQRSSKYIDVPCSGFRGDMLHYFNDCPELHDKIEKKEYGRGDMVKIVKFYNDHCVSIKGED